MTAFDSELNARLAAIRGEGLYRELRRVDSAQGPRIRIGGRELLNFSSNDYLGLANHPALKEAGVNALQQFGAGSGASRLLCGSLAPHHELEETLAAFKGTEAALSFSSGYATAIGTLCALMGKDDIILSDKLVHACIVDAARLCGATIRIFGHNELDELEELLRWSSSPGLTGPARNRERPARMLIVTESVFSMDGDRAPLREIVALKEKYGAWLMVDEAHATGLYGANRRGVAEELGVSDRIEIQMGTLGKALGASGGYICGSRALIDFLINRARSFIFSTAPIPAAAAAAAAAVKLVQSEEGETRLEALRARVAECRTSVAPVLSSLVRSGGEGKPGLRDVGFSSGAILPLILGEEAAAVAAANALRERGLFVPAIRYPTVARGSARLRLTLTAAHSPADVAALTSALVTLDLGPQT